jgi:transcriptional regulator
MPERVDLLHGTLDMLILQALTWGPMHGFGVSRWIERHSGDHLAIEEGALYPALHRVHRRGWVEAAWGTSDNKRRARFYRLTQAGRNELAARVRSWRTATSAVNRILQTQPA